MASRALDDGRCYIAIKRILHKGGAEVPQNGMNSQLLVANHLSNTKDNTIHDLRLAFFLLTLQRDG